MVLATIAAKTSVVRLGTGILVLPMRDPVLLAGSAQAVQPHRASATLPRMPRGTLQGALCRIGRRMIIVGHARCQVIKAARLNSRGARIVDLADRRDDPSTQCAHSGRAHLPLPPRGDPIEAVRCHPRHERAAWTGTVGGMTGQPGQVTLDVNEGQSSSALLRRGEHVSGKQLAGLTSRLHRLKRTAPHRLAQQYRQLVGVAHGLESLGHLRGCRAVGLYDPAGVVVADRSLFQRPWGSRRSLASS